jgi:SynChlorMet cassette radical SAM/SPASM protein ScmF
MKLKGSYPLNSIYFYLNKSCNLACRHCWIDPHHTNSRTTSDSLPFSKFKSIIYEALPLGLSTVKLSGGEPLLHARISEILQFLQKIRVKVLIETNGILITPQLAHEISQCNKPFISIGFDGSNPEIHEWVRGAKGCFQSAFTGFQNCVTVGLHPQLVFTLMKKNCDDLQNFINFAERSGASSIKINVVQPIARGKTLEEKGEILGIEQYVRIGEYIERNRHKLANIPIIYSHPPAFRPLSTILEHECGCDVCGIKGILGVLNDGSFSLCGIGMTEPCLVLTCDSNTTLAELWDSDHILAKIRNGLPDNLQGVCKRCCT